MYNKLSKNILVVEDSVMFTRILKRSIESVDGFKVITVESFGALKQLLSEKKYQFFASLLDVNLPDAPNGEVIDFVLAHNIPSIIFTGKLDESFRKKIYTKGIVDYVLKEGPANIEYVVSLLSQLKRNSNIDVLVVDDSISVRSYIKHLLVIYQFTVFEAVDGVDALEKVKRNSNISLVLTDFNMPNMDGLALTKQLRRQYSSQQMAIIGMSAFGNNQLSAHFLKLGGSDFITKPFLEEEFFCRINQNMELLEHIKQLKFLATRDFLTGLFNRRYFFDVGNNIVSGYKKKGLKLGIALLDIDHFKKVNDNYGHDAGDLVLCQLGKRLIDNFEVDDLSSSIVARYGGEEFCFLLVAKTHSEIEASLSALRQSIEDDKYVLKEGFELKITASIGLFTGESEDLKVALSIADKALYQAKASGRNQVVVLDI
ncbi:GGDEF domain-containing response regulator [Psychromonas hadalis]|uniref:GGDEF domain-containing response regulator n=1 Tax=Psychromonas hadalis TaxID=211669 RepID=UPI0003B6C5F0|nr:diguanylate cyclase [Psychromonas hadalis]